MIIITYPRANMSDGRGNNMIVACDQSGTILWRYDITSGVDANGNAIFAGQPQIDSSGNVYIPWYATATGTGTSHAGVLKLDDTGTLIWNYDHGSGSGGDPTSTDKVQASDFDSSGNIAFRVPKHAAGTFIHEFMLVVDPSGALAKTYTWTGTADVEPASVTYGIAIDGNNNLYACSEGTALVNKFDSTTAWVSHFNASTGGGGFLACDKTNGKLYVYQANSAAPISTSLLMQRWDLSTATPTKDWEKTYNDIFSADTLNYTNTTRPTFGGIGFDPLTATSTVAMGRARSSLGGDHVVANMLNLTGSTGAKNFSVVVDTAITGGFNADFVAVDPVGSGIYCASKIGSSTSPFNNVFSISSGGIIWSSAALAPSGASAYKGMAALTYTV
jgi:hypothetical protein